MATINKLPSGKWRVRVRHRKHPCTSKSFTYRKDALKWAKLTEVQIERNEYQKNKSQFIFLKDILQNYLKIITPKKRGKSQEEYKLKKLIEHPIAYTKLNALLPPIFAYYRDARLKEVSSTTVRKECALLSHAINIAKKEWACDININPLTQISLPINNPSRKRRLETGEFEKLSIACKQVNNIWLYPLFILAIVTAMRRGELLSINIKNTYNNNSICKLLNTKNGEERIVPLSFKSMQVIKQLPKSLNGKLFPILPSTVRYLWKKACQKACVYNLRFHDLRHEATSRLFEKGLNVMEVASITGHKDLRMLEVYTHLKAEYLVKKL